MGNKYFSIRTTSAADCLADVKAALEAVYGLYNVDTNPTGVVYDYDVPPYLIFRCTAIADKRIRLYIATDNPLWGFGDEVSGNTLTNLIPFGGSSSTGGWTEAHMVLGPHTLLWMNLESTLYSRLVMIGQLTNDDYAVLGMVGNSNTSYNVSCAGWNTTDGVSLWPVAMESGFQSAAGKLYTQALVLKHGVTGLELNGDGSIASFQDIVNASYSTTATVAVWGATFVLTVGSLYMDSGWGPALRTCLLMSYD